MKLINIIRESSNISSEIGENAAVKGLFFKLLGGVNDLTIAGLKNSGKLRLVTLSDDVVKVFNAKGITGMKTADDVIYALGKNSLKPTALGDFAVGVMKTKDVSSTQIMKLAPDFVTMPNFIKRYATEGKKLTRAGLKKSGYSDIAATEILKASKNSKKFQDALKGVSKTGTKTGVEAVKGGLRKVYNDTVSYLKGNKNAAKNLGNLPKSSRTVRLLKWMVRTSVKGVVKVWTLKWLIILGLGGYLAWNWKEWMGLGDLTKWDNDDFEPEVDFLKCILIPLGDDEGVKIESDDKGNPVLYYIKGSSYDDQGGLIFRVDGSVETGDGSKKGTWSCNTSGLDIQEQSTGSEITSKELSIVIEDLNDNLSGDLFDGDSTDMVDALNIVKGVVGKTYKGKTAIKTIIHNYPILHGNSVIDDINSLTNLDFNGLEQKKELLSLLGLSSGKSSGGNQSGDSDKKGDSDVKGDGNTSTGISHITIKWGSGKTTPVVGKVKYVQCKDLPFKYGCISDKIKTIQKCLPAELKVDGYYGPKTSNALWNLYQGKEKGDITKSVYDKIMVACEKKDEKTKSTEPRKKIEPITKLEPKGLAPLKIYDTDAVIAKIDPVVMAANIQKTIDGRRIDSIIANDLKYSAGRYVLRIDDELTDNQLKTINLYMASKGFKVLRKKRETLDGSKYVWKPDSKDAKRIARKERSIKKDQDKINDIKNKDNE